MTLETIVNLALVALFFVILIAGYLLPPSDDEDEDAEWEEDFWGSFRL